jgi:hypothetical protein
MRGGVPAWQFFLLLFSFSSRDDCSYSFFFFELHNTSETWGATGALVTTRLQTLSRSYSLPFRVHTVYLVVYKNRKQHAPQVACIDGHMARDPRPGPSPVKMAR